MFKAVVQGYEDRITDQMVVAIYNGMYAAYYNNNKHAKAAHILAKQLVDSHYKSRVKKSKTSVPDVDVEAFEKMDKAFKEQWAKKVGEPLSG